MEFFAIDNLHNSMTGGKIQFSHVNALSKDNILNFFFSTAARIKTFAPPSMNFDKNSNRSN